jgi:signal transduction histidine kinase/DNA-binding response OmpR family regulator
VANETVLVVDDSRDNLEFIVEYVLKPHGYQTLTASDGAEGLELALTENPDLILLDVNMPKLSGLEVLEALEREGRQIPVILMTFHGSETLAVQAFRLGVKDYVIKPFQVNEMVEALERALTEVRLRQERDQLTARLIAVNKQLEQRVKELNTLYGVGKSVTSVLDLEILLGRLVEAAVYLTSADEGSLLLVDEATDELYIMAAQGVEEKVARSLRLRVDDSIAGQVIRSGQPTIISGPGQQKIKTAYLVQSLIYVPINVKNHTIGVLGVDNRATDHCFSQHDLYLLSALADYAAIALENARLFGEAESERRRLGAILGGVTEPVIVTNHEDSQVMLINEAALKAFNLESAGVEGSPLVELLDNSDLLDLIAQSADGSEETLTTEVPLEDERTLHASVTSIPAVGKVIVMQDITHLKELDRMKSEFVDTVSHDLRSPLTSIKGYTEMLQMIGELNEQQAEFARRIVGGVQRITELIEDLLDIGRIESGVDWMMQPADMITIAQEVVSDLHGGAQTKKQTINLEHPGQLSTIMGNAVRLRQVLSNLVGNAIKYTPAEGTINLSLEQDGDQIIIRVQDNGFGIAEADLPYVFDKFYRVKNKKTEMISGTGLGLSIVKSIVEKHEGQIWVESELDKGTTFTFTLPIVPADEEEREPVAVQEASNPL